MIKTFLFFLFNLIFVISYSQQKSFFSKSDRTTDSLDSYYFNVSVPIGENKYRTESYYTHTGSIRFKEEEIDDKGNSDRTYFFPDGSLRAKGRFIFGAPTGRFDSFYLNGMKHAEIVFDIVGGMPPERVTFVNVINYWDSLGNKIIDSGNGMCNCWLESYNERIVIETGKVEKTQKVGDWKGTDITDGSSFGETYDHGKLVSGKQIDNEVSYSYTQIEQSALPKGGFVEFYKYVGNVITYPKARRNGIQGRVFVEFVIDREGNISECQIVKGISKECDEEALKVIKSSPQWNNGTYRGKPVKQRMILPLTFKLG